jgi:hypothetical protein
VKYSSTMIILGSLVLWLSVAAMIFRRHAPGYADAPTSLKRVLMLAIALMGAFGAAMIADGLGVVDSSKMVLLLSAIEAPLVLIWSRYVVRWSRRSSNS